MKLFYFYIFKFIAEFDLTEALDQLQGVKEENDGFEKCPVCGGQLVGETESSCVAAAAALRVCADVSQRCRERLCSQDAVRRFEEIQDSGGSGGGPRRFGVRAWISKLLG